MTYFVLLHNTKQLVTCSNVHPVKDQLFPSQLQHPTLPDGDTSVPVEKPILTSIQDYYEDPVNLLTFSPDELIGMMVLHEVDEKLIRGKVIWQIID